MAESCAGDKLMNFKKEKQSLAGAGNIKKTITNFRNSTLPHNISATSPFTIQCSTDKVNLARCKVQHLYNASVIKKRL